MTPHHTIKRIAESHIQPKISRLPCEQFTEIGKRHIGEYVRQKVVIRDDDGSFTRFYVTVPLWEREI